jgi:hypothetical protein
MGVLLMGEDESKGDFTCETVNKLRAYVSDVHHLIV